MTEFGLARKIISIFKVGVGDGIESSSVGVPEDDLFFDPDYLTTSTVIEGFGSVKLLADGQLKIDSAQLVKLREYEVGEGLTPSESVSLGDGNFLVRLKKE